jgi:hypothetical protein
VGCEHAWAQRVLVALDRVASAVRRHAAEDEGPGGSLAEADLTRPTLVRQAVALRRQHAELIAEATALRDEAARVLRTFDREAAPEPAAPILDFIAIRRRARNLLAVLEAHKEKETDLVLESVSTDIGVGD